MESEEAKLPPPGKSSYARIEEKIIHLTRSNVEQKTKEILEILEEGEILYPTQGPSIMKRLIGKTDDLYMEPCFAELVKTMYSIYKESALASEEDLKNIVWEQSRYGTPNKSERQRSNRITTKKSAADVIAKLKIFTPLDAELNTRILWNYSDNCVREKEWNSYFVDLLTFLVREGGDPFYPLGPENGLSLITAFTLFLGNLSSYLSDSMMTSVLTFLEEAFKKWEVSISKESILNDVIKNLPSDVVKGESSHRSSIKGLIVGNCLKIIETHSSLCEIIDGDRKTPLHRLMERILHDGRWQQISELVAGTDILWDLMSAMLTNKNVNIKDRDKVTPYTWILWWQKHVTNLQTLDVQMKQKLERKIEDIKKYFQGKGASEEDALQGMKNMKTTSQYKRIEEKIECLSTSNIEQETKEILEILKEGEIIYPTEGPSIMKKLVGKTDDLYMEPSFAQLVKTLHCSYEASALAREEDLTNMVWYQLRYGATDLSERKEEICITKSIAAEVIAKLKIYTPLEAMLCARILWDYIHYCDTKKEWSSHFVDLLTFLFREGADPFYPMGPGGKPPFETAFQGFLRRFSSHLADSLVPSVSTFMEEAFRKLTDSMSEENALNIVIKSIPSNIIEGGDRSCSSIKELIVINCLKMIETHPSLCDHSDGEGKTPLHRLMDGIMLDSRWQQISELVAGTDVLWDLMSAMITNKNVNIKDRDKVTPFTWILWWQKHVTDLQTIDALEKQKLERKIEDTKKHFQGKGASEEDALQGMKNLKTKSQYKRIEEKIECLTTSNIEQETKEILEILKEGEIIYPTKGPSIMKKLVGKTDDLYMERSFAQLVKTLHCSYETSALAREEDLAVMVDMQMIYGTTDQSEEKEAIYVANKSVATEVIAKLKIYTPLEADLCTRILWIYIHNCDIKKERNSHFVHVLTFLIREGADPFYTLGPGGKPPFETAFQDFLWKFSSHLAESLMPSVSTFMEEAFRKLTDSISQENALNIVIRSIPSNVIEGGDTSCSSMKELIVENCLKMIETHPSLCDHLDGEGKSPLHILIEIIVIDGLWQQISELVAGTDVLWDLMSGMITNKNVNIKDRDKVTPFTWIIWWQKHVTDLQTIDALEKQKLERKMENIKEHFHRKGASEEGALEGMKNLKTKS